MIRMFARIPIQLCQMLQFETGECGGEIRRRERVCVCVFVLIWNVRERKKRNASNR